MKKYDIIIIGGGAAGLLAGCVASQSNRTVLIIDRLPKLGRKILVSGGGRCNMTRQISVQQLVGAYYQKKNFVKPAIYNFSAEHLREYFLKLGLATKVDDSNGVYPASNKADDVYSALFRYLQEKNVDILNNSAVEEILFDENSVKGVRCAELEYYADNVILAAGGKGEIQLGADGSGFELAVNTGHSIIDPVGGIVGLQSRAELFSGLAGITLDDCTIKVANKKKEQFSGSILITHKGISGPAVLNASRVVQREVVEQNKCCMSICWKSSRDCWEDKFVVWRQQHGVKNIEDMLLESFPQRFVKQLLAVSGIENKTKFAELKKKYRLLLLDNITNYRINITKLEKIEKSMVCSGGVDTAEIYSKSLESKLVKGLYFAGEVVDVDGECGGYNLQWAFSSAVLAVKSIITGKS